MKKIIASSVFSAALIFGAATVHAQTKPAELKIPFATFLSGPAAVFGIAGKAGAEIAIDEINAAGGVDGVKLRMLVIDEGVGPDRLLSEYRRLVQEERVTVSSAAISSGSCNILAPVAEDLKVVNVLWGCGSEKTLEARRYKYVFRPASNMTTDFTSAALYLVKHKPDFKTIAVINQDYAYGRDSWEIFITALRAIKPDVKVVAELFPKFGSTDFSSEISRLQALSPDVIMSGTWGGELDTLVRQANQRGLMKKSTWVLPLGENSLERLGKGMPDGVIVGMRGDYYHLDPTLSKDPKVKAFVEKFKAKTGGYPTFPAYQGAVSMFAIADAYNAAIKQNGGKWPDTSQVADAMHKLKLDHLGRKIVMREDGQGLQDNLVGITKMTPNFPFPIIDDLTLFPATITQAPVGLKAVDWAKTIKPELVNSPEIKKQ